MNLKNKVAIVTGAAIPEHAKEFGISEALLCGM